MNYIFKIRVRKRKKVNRISVVDICKNGGVILKTTRIYRTEICRGIDSHTHTCVRLNAIWGKVWRVRINSIKRDVPRMLVKHSPPRGYWVVTRSRFLGIVIAYLGDSAICMRWTASMQIIRATPWKWGWIFVHDYSLMQRHFLSVAFSIEEQSRVTLVIFLQKCFFERDTSFRHVKNYLLIFREWKVTTVVMLGKHVVERRFV